MGADVLWLACWGKQAGLRSLEEHSGLEAGQELPVLRDARMWGDRFGDELRE